MLACCNRRARFSRIERQVDLQSTRHRIILAAAEHTPRQRSVSGSAARAASTNSKGSSGSHSASKSNAKAQQAAQDGEPHAPTTQDADLVEVGRIVGVHGVKGEVKVMLSTDSPSERFGAKGVRLYLQPPLKVIKASREPLPLMQVAVESHKVRFLPGGVEAWVIKFREVTDRNQAEQLHNCSIVMRGSDRPPLEDPDEFYTQELVGCRVFNLADGSHVGNVLDLISGTGTHDTMLVQMRTTPEDIKTSRTRQLMIPFAKEICPVVNPTARCIGIDPPGGLLDLWSARKLKKALTGEQVAQKLAELKAAPVPSLWDIMPELAPQPDSSDDDGGEEDASKGEDANEGEGASEDGEAQASDGDEGTGGASGSAEAGGSNSSSNAAPAPAAGAGAAAVAPSGRSSKASDEDEAGPHSSRGGQVSTQPQGAEEVQGEEKQEGKGEEEEEEKQQQGAESPIGSSPHAAESAEESGARRLARPQRMLRLQRRGVSGRSGLLGVHRLRAGRARGESQADEDDS